MGLVNGCNDFGCRKMRKIQKARGDRAMRILEQPVCLVLPLCRLAESCTGGNGKVRPAVKPLLGLCHPMTEKECDTLQNRRGVLRRRCCLLDKVGEVWCAGLEESAASILEVMQPPGGEGGDECRRGRRGPPSRPVTQTAGYTRTSVLSVASGNTHLCSEATSYSSFLRIHF